MKISTRKLVYTALFAAVIFVATYIIKVPTPTNGYVNIGDAAVILGAFVLGPLFGAIAAGIGSCLTDVVAGYMAYAPATFIIKFIMAAVCGLIFSKNRKTPGLIIGVLVSEIIMVYPKDGRGSSEPENPNKKTCPYPNGYVRSENGQIMHNRKDGYT